jgi:hydrogenase expression/formation protein HypC
MCLAVPMKLISVRDDAHGTAELDGAHYEVALGLVERAAVGDYVIVHAGFAIERLDEAEAEARLALFAEWAEAERANPSALGASEGPGDA